MMTTVKAKATWRLLASVLMLVCLIAFCPLTAAQAAEVEPVEEAPVASEPALFPGNCTMTVYPANPASDMAEDVATAEVVVDVYRIADGIADPVYDMYNYRMTEPFASLTVDDAMDSEKWTALAQQAASIVRAEGLEPLLTGETGEGTVVPDSDTLTAGLYLLLARSSSFTEADDIFVDMEAEEEGATGSIVTHAQSDTYHYYFAPQLVSLPGKGDLDGSTTMTSDPGEWLEHLTVYLKPSREYRMCDIVIEKTLTDFVGTTDAPFVFSITATQEIRGEVKTVFSRVVMMSFSSAGTKTLTLEKVVPVGAKVTITETYDGGSYALVSQSEVPVIAAADQAAMVSFTNSPDDYRPSEGIVNRFTHTENDWPWTSIRDESDVANREE